MARMMKRSVYCSFTVLAVIGIGSGRSCADSLSLKDGRFVDDRSIEKIDGFYKVQFDNGEVSIPESLVAEHFQMNDAGDFVPTTPKEEEWAAKGMVPWRGRWVTKSSRKRHMKNELERRRKRLEQRKERRFWRNHATVRSKRFVFHHTLSDEIFEEFQDLFETYFDFFVKYWGIRPSRNFGKPVVNIYHDKDYFEQVSGAPSGVVGYYQPADRELHFFYDRERSHFTVDVMFHEGNHLLCHMIDDKFRYPWWIGEGMAEYFGASEWDSESKTMSTGHLQSARLAVLNDQIEDGKWLDLEELVRASRMGAVEYSWAWSLCHFLLSTPKYSRAFKKFFLGLARSSSIQKKDFGGWKMVSGQEQVDALYRYLRIPNLEVLERQWYEYIRANLNTHRSELNHADAAWIMLLYGERRKARLLFKKAIDSGSIDAFVHYGYARLQYDRRKTKTALRYAENAAKFDPLHARAWSLIGRCKSRLGEKELADRLVKLAQELDPDDATLWFDAELAQEEAESRGDGKPPRGG